MSYSQEALSGRTPPGVRERILDAAVEILRESGLRDLTQVHVSEMAGVRQSHLTYYFPKRADLLEAVTERVVGGIASGVQQAVMDAGAAGHGAILERLTESVIDRGHMRMFLATVVEADADPALRKVVIKATSRMESALVNAMGGDHARERARVILSALWGLGLYHFTVRPSSRADPTTRFMSCLRTVSGGTSASARRGSVER